MTLSLSTFMLGLYVFLQSAATHKWFSVDAKLTSFIGLAFVVLLIFETVFRNGFALPSVSFRRKNQA